METLNLVEMSLKKFNYFCNDYNFLLSCKDMGNNSTSSRAATIS